MLNDVPQILTEVEAGEGISLSQAAKQIPGSGGKGLDPSTCFRWTQTGARSATGERVKLEFLRVGGRIVTSQAAVRRFLLALTKGTKNDPAPAPRTPAQRRKAVEKAEKKLIEMGA
ncbi:MAG: DUF1580 domain-containing protein [Fimbriimonadaceae bacterium]|nr:DUF1580 domain-containing protein [Fimbriimonadaceae bacterium]